jgi:hypothetical protein
MWAGGHAESCGAGVTVLDWLEDVIVRAENDIFKAYWCCSRRGTTSTLEKSSLDCVRDDELLAEASN